MPSSNARDRARAPQHSGQTLDPRRALAALRLLARPQAIAIETGSELETKIVQVAPCGSASENADRGPSLIGEDDWTYILKRGWAVPDETRKGWRISNAGRIALKRLSSSRGAPGDDCNKSACQSSFPTRVSRRPETGKPQQNDGESPLAWLRQRFDKQGRRFISQEEFAAGERLRRDFTYGSLTPSVTSNWSPVVGGTSRGTSSDRELELRDGQLRARERFRAALAATGPEFSNILVDVCCFLRGLEEVEQKYAWPRRTAKVVLQLALRALARFYGIGDRHSKTVDPPQCHSS